MRKKLGDITFKIVVGIVSSVIFISAIYYANDGFFASQDQLKSVHETVRVTEVIGVQIEANENGIVQGEMRLIVEVTTGLMRGEMFKVTYYLNQLTSSKVEVGDHFAVRMTIDDGQILSLQIQNPERRGAVLVIFIVFLIILGALGGKKGLLAVASLVFTLICIIFLLIPLILQGYPVILTTFLILGLVTIVSITCVAGLKSKGISALIGCLVGLLITAILTHFAGHLAHISGFHMEEVGLILATTNFPLSQASGLFISGVLIAALGAILDTAMTISSTIYELRVSNKKMSLGRLFRSGMNVGRDTMGTMTTTLILAFAGTSFNMLILIYSGGVDFNQLINSNFIVIEIIRSIAGSLGIILTIPVVALVSCVLE